MNTVPIAAVISACYLFLKMMALYKENKRPDLGDVLYVFVACIFGITAMDHYSTTVSPKTVEVFTELP
jgi:hypothetical protein